MRTLAPYRGGYSRFRKLFPVRTLKRAEARGPERGIYAASPFAVREVRILFGRTVTGPGLRQEFAAQDDVKFMHRQGEVGKRFDFSVTRRTGLQAPPSPLEAQT